MCGEEATREDAYRAGRSPARRDLFAGTLPAWPLRIGARPHVSILVVDSASSHQIDAIYRPIVTAPRFRLVFNSADYFGDDDGVIFLKPDDSAELHKLHKRAVAEARSGGLKPRRAGDEWVPHCTCDYSLTKEQIPMGLLILKRFLPLHVRVEQVGYVEVGPQSVRPIASTELVVTDGAG